MITIIILLILAMISLAIPFGENGVLLNAKTAINNNGKAKVKEAVSIAWVKYKSDNDDLISDDNKEKFKEYIERATDIPVDVEQNNGEYIVKYKIDENDDDYEGVFVINEKGKLREVEWQQYGTIVKNIKTGQELEVGDKVYYDSGVAAYEGNGTVQGKWAILGAENGKLLLMSVSSIGKQDLMGANDWLSEGSIKLDNKCKSFMNSLYAENARSVNVEDINRITGYIPETPKKYTYEIDANNKIFRTDYGNPASRTFVDVNGVNISTVGKFEIENTFYSYNIRSYLQQNSKAYNLITSNYDTQYLLNSTDVRCNYYAALYDFMELDRDYVDAYVVYESDGTRIAGPFYENVRAVIVLKPEVNILERNTNDGYDINKNS